MPRHNGLIKLKGQIAARRPSPRRETGAGRDVAFNSAARQPEELRLGLCRTADGMIRADRGMNEARSPVGIEDRDAAKRMCHACPVRKICLSYVLQHEKPAGSWGGVWGGLDVFNRRGRSVIRTPAGTKTIDFSIESYVRWAG